MLIELIIALGSFENIACVDGAQAPLKFIIPHVNTLGVLPIADLPLASVGRRDIIEHLSSVSPRLLFLSALFTMFGVQLLKQLGLRAFWNRRFLFLWLRSRAQVRRHALFRLRTFRRLRLLDWIRAAYAGFFRPSGGFRAALALLQLEQLMAARPNKGGSPSALYELSADQVCGQVAAAAELAIASPDKYGHFYRAMTRGLDLATLGEYSKCVSQAKDDNARDLEGVKSAKLGKTRAPVAMYVQRTIDSLQVEMGRSWQQAIRTACILTSFAVAGVLVIPTSTSSWLVYGIGGALIAPVVRDLLAAIQNLRHR